MHKYQGMGTVPLHLQLSGTGIETEAGNGAADVKMTRKGTGGTGGVRAKVRVGAGMGQGRPPQYWVG